MNAWTQWPSVQGEATVAATESNYGLLKETEQFIIFILICQII